MRKQCILFKYTTGPYGWLSNFSHDFVADETGKIWPSSEALYQSMKFCDEASKEKIRLAPSAKLAAQLGRTLTGMRPDWDLIKIDAMRRVLALKVQTHPALGQRLVETGDADLVESSNKDDFWGVLPNGHGQNWLGKLWMELREKLCSKGKNE